MSFKRVGEGLPGLVARWIDDPELHWGLLLQAWSTAVGDAVARHTELVSIDQGTLTVQVQDPAWRRTLEAMEPELVAKLQQAMGERVVVAIRWLPTGSWRSGRGDRHRESPKA